VTPDAAIVMLTVRSDDVAGEEAVRLTHELGAAVSVDVADLLSDAPAMGASWSAAIEIHGAVEGIANAVRGMADRLGSAIDAAESSIVVGNDRLIFERPMAPGVDPVKIYYALFPKSNVSRSQFEHHWYEIHAKVVDRDPYPLMYRQLHGDDIATPAANEAAGFGVTDIAGIAHESFVDRDDFAAALIDPSLDGDRADLGLFSDVARNRAILAKVRPR
jgi:hypothetical protein